MLHTPGSPRPKLFPRILVSILWGLYILAFGLYYPTVGLDIISLSIFPIMGAGWYFGFGVSILVAILTVIANLAVLVLYKQSILATLTNPIDLFSNLALLVTAAIVGRIGSVARERGDALDRLQRSEEDRKKYTDFLEFLNNIIRTALEVHDLTSTHNVLLEQIAGLFKADSGYLALWDDATNTPIPMAVFGSMKVRSPHPTHPEDGTHTLARSLIQAGHPLAITDLENSPHINPNLDSLFPSRSVLGLPLIVQDRNLAVLYLGYNESRSFDQREIAYAEIAAQQIALVLTKIQLLEDTQKRVRHLTVLHEVALASTQVDTTDQLIASATEVIGKNLFPDNFGILLIDEDKGLLRPQPSYRFVPVNEHYHPAEVPLGEGITGQVALTGRPIRIGNVDGFQNYLNVDSRTSSELCVPIKLKDRVLGVINAESTGMDAFSSEDEFLLETLADHLATAIEKLRATEGERRWLDQLAHSNDLIYSLAHITTHIEKALSSDEIIQTLGRELRKIELNCLMSLYDKSRELFIGKYITIKPEPGEGFENDIKSPWIIHSFSLDTLKSTLMTEDIFNPALVSDPGNEIQIMFASTMQGETTKIPRVSEIEGELIRLPLIVEENLLGILWVWGKGITRADLPVISIFGKQVGISLERTRLFQEVQDLALTDPLTSLNNRRSLFQVGRIEFLRARRLDRPFSCLMLDIDHFKQVNDTYGHQTGDKVLQESAKRCRDTIREIDLIGRYGGEELLLLLPETEVELAALVAERLRLAISGHPMMVADWIALDVTVSIGVATKDNNTLDLETLIARADQAMYIAKHKGRNRVAVSK